MISIDQGLKHILNSLEIMESESLRSSDVLDKVGKWCLSHSHYWSSRVRYFEINASC